MTLAEVKETYSMRDILDRYGLRPNRSGFLNCPFHREKSSSMKIYEKDAHCFGCGWHGDIIDFVAGMDALSFREAFVSLGGTYDTENREEVRRKILAAEQARQEKREKEAEMKRQRDANNNYITALRSGLDCFPVFSDEWCFCQNQLAYQLYLHEELNGYGGGTM